MRIYMSPVPGPPHPPPNGIPPPLLTPPTPQNLVFACYLHIYIHIYTYILPFPPLQPRISTLFAALETTTSSTDFVYLYISIITFFSNRLQRASHMVYNIFATYGLRKAYLCKPRHMYSRKTINIYIYICTF